MKISTEEFIRRSRINQGSKYDYSKAVYKDSLTKVIIICPKHGEFSQLPHNHMKGCGCTLCAGEATRRRQLKLNEDFIKEANEVHNNKYSYEKTKYTKAKDKVIITCPRCGDFYQNADSHLSGSGCPRCWVDKIKISEKEFRKRLNKKNKERNLDYSFVSFTNNTKAAISCPKHGVFNICPDTYFRSNQICPKCLKEHKFLKSWESFRERASIVHNNKYDYSFEDYKSRGKIKIFCKVHGYFEVYPFNHLNGQGCSFCTEEAYLAKRRESYFARVNKKHKNEYSYLEEDYFNKDSIIRVICSKHGLFNMHAGYHASGTKCPSCNIKSRGEHNIGIYLTDKSIDFSTEIRYNECKDKRALPFDIGVKIDNSIVGLIEFDGIHHFKPNASRDKEGHLFKTIVRHDEIKNDFCKDENIPLLRIPYYERDWKQILDNFLRSLNIDLGER
jgi:hypothetical protein